MKKRASLYSVLAVVLFCSFLGKFFLSPSSISYKNFELLDGKKTHFWKNLSTQDKQDIALYKKLYLKHWPLLLKNSSSASKIPKVIHYIWLGPKEFPETSIAYVQSCIQNHPGWVVKFWTDRADRALPCPKMEKHLISELSLPSIGEFLDKTDNYGEKSDLLRYEILMQEGGIYFDHDIECYHSFDPLVSSVDFFAGLEPPHRNTGIETRIFPCNAVIGAKPSHPIIAKSLQYVQSRWNEVEKIFPGGDAKSQTHRVFLRTFHSFSLGTKEAIGLEGNVDILLPASFFYPDRITTKESFELWRSKGLIWTSHKCLGAWRPEEAPNPLEEQLEIVKKEKKELKRKLSQTKIFLYSNFAVTLVAGLFILQNRKKKRAFFGGKDL